MMSNAKRFLGIEKLVRRVGLGTVRTGCRAGRPILGRFHRRVGLTLVELLVVVGVVTVLAAIVLPSIKNVLTDRKSSQTAVVVRNFIEAARARAIGKNRSVAVVLERVSSRAVLGAVGFESTTSSYSITSPDTNYIPYNACVRLSLAEEPSPFGSDTLGMPVNVTAYNQGNGAIPNMIYTGVDTLVDLDAPGEVRVLQFSCPAFPSSAVVYDLLADYLVAGNEISLGDSKRRFKIMSPRNKNEYGTSPNPHLASSNNDNTIWVSIGNEVGIDGAQETALEPYVPIPSGFTWTRFKIYPKPRPVYSQTVQLPKGMCIDLSLSGFAHDPNGSFGSVPATAPENRLRFASDWVMAGAAGTPLPNQMRPVSIVFNSSGQLSHVYANEPLGGATAATYVGNATRIDATDDLFLHIGKINQVVMPYNAAGVRSSATVLAAASAGTAQNITDVNSFVIRLSPKSGTITAAPARAISTAASLIGVSPASLSLGDLVQLVRSGAYSSTASAQ